MADVIANLTGTQFSGESIAVDRSALRPSLSSTARAERFERVVNGVARLRPAANGELASLQSS
jgi:predicted transcriptional regulator of viral defense system